MDFNIIYRTIDKINQITGFELQVKTCKAFDNQKNKFKIQFQIDKKRVKFTVQFIEVLNKQKLPEIFSIAHNTSDFLIFSGDISFNIRDILRKEQINYLDKAGNIFINKEEILILLEGFSEAEKEKEKTKRVFAKSGLKTIFLFLHDEKFINLPYRDISKYTKTSLGNIKYIFEGLKENGYIIKIDNKNKQLINKKNLLEKWVNGYIEKLKPSLFMETYRFLNNNLYNKWKNIEFNKSKTFWGGEAGGDILTNYLKPEIFTIYTDENRNELIKNYKLIPDPKGDIKVFKKFWNIENEYNLTAPPLIVYADLISQEDRRCLETAKKIYDEYIKYKL